MRRDLALGKVGAVKLVGLLLALSTAAMVLAQHTRSLSEIDSDSQQIPSEFCGGGLS